MDAELKTKWVAALRSGEYEQARGAMKVDDRYCCLGVLSVVLSPGAARSSYLSGCGYPNSSLQTKSGLSWDEMRELALMNDKGKTFPEIADYIEANL